MHFLPQHRDLMTMAIRRGVDRALHQRAEETALPKELTIDRPLKVGELVMINGQPHRVTQAKPGATPGSVQYSAVPGINRHERRAARAETLKSIRS